MHSYSIIVLEFLKSNCNFITGSDDSGYVATAECLVSENAERVFNAEKDLGSVDIVEPVDDVSEDSRQMELGTLTLSVCAAAEDQKQHIELQNQVIIMFDIMSVKDTEVVFDRPTKSFGKSNIIFYLTFM